MGPRGQGDGVLSLLQWPGCPTALGTTQSLFTLGCPWGNEFFSPLSLSSFPTEAGKPFNYTLSQTRRGTMPSGHLGSKEETPFRFSLLPRRASPLHQQWWIPGPWLGRPTLQEAALGLGWGAREQGLWTLMCQAEMEEASCLMEFLDSLDKSPQKGLWPQLRTASSVRWTALLDPGASR